MFTHKLLILAPVLICCIASLILAQSPAFRGGDDWCGNPDAIQSPDNPYVTLANSNAVRDRSQNTNPFWLVWGTCAPESQLLADAALREQAITVMDYAVAQTVEKQETFWSILTNLECIRMWQRATNPPAEKITQWLNALQPIAEKSYQDNANPSSWTSVAANTLHQSAAIPQLAGQLYNDTRYTQMAHDLVVQSQQMQEVNGAFHYIRESGPSQVYYGFDASFLGRYYQLSRDPLAKQMLIKLAAYSKDALANGLMEGASAPWWKHHWGTGGPIHGVEIAAGLSRDPLTRTLAQYRRDHNGQRYMYSYYPMYFWDPTIPGNEQLGADLIRYNTNFDGPQLRKGDWQVVLPGKAYADTHIGISVASGQSHFGFEGYLNVVALPVLRNQNYNAYARPQSLITAGTDALPARRSLVGTDWIANAWQYQPKQAFFANSPEPASGDWTLTQLWFADDQGAAGWLSIYADVNTDNALPRGYLSVSHDISADASNPMLLTSGSLQYQLLGTQVSSVELITENDKTRQAWVHVADVSSQSHAAGDTFGYGLSASKVGTEPYGLQTQPLADGVLAITITRPGKPTIHMAYNHSQTLQTFTPPAISCWRVAAAGHCQQTSTISPDTDLAIQPGELILLQ